MMNLITNRTSLMVGDFRKNIHRDQPGILEALEALKNLQEQYGVKPGLGPLSRFVGGGLSWTYSVGPHVSYNSFISKLTDKEIEAVPNEELKKLLHTARLFREDVYYVNWDKN